MSLKIRLKSGERLIVGGAVVRNGKGLAELIIENNVPILREKDILSERDVSTVAKGIYFIIQLMYVDRENFTQYREKYLGLVEEIVLAAPSTKDFIVQINTKISEMDFYHALKLANNLIAYEKELMQNAAK